MCHNMNDMDRNAIIVNILSIQLDYPRISNLLVSVVKRIGYFCFKLRIER